MTFFNSSNLRLIYMLKIKLTICNQEFGHKNLQIFIFVLKCACRLKNKI